jgi:hypothetical protein
MPKIVPANPTAFVCDDVMASTAAITPIEYSGLQAAYDHFNTELFGGRLPNLMITYQRKGRTRGYYSHRRFAERVGNTLVGVESPHSCEESICHGELALNPDHFTGRTDREICSTLVHEMVHAWQFAFGKPSRRGYHNRQWATKMKEVGLYPSSTGDVGGRETGQSMSHYIIDGGSFDLAFGQLAASGWRLNLQSAPHANMAKPPDGRLKFTCPGCDDSFRGKHDLVPLCARCERYFVPTGSTEEEMIEAGRKARTEQESAVAAGMNPETGLTGTIQ